MRQLKGAIQEIADRINDPIIDDNISSIKAMVVIDRNVQDAIQAHLDKKEAAISKTNENVIVTGEDMRKAMNREIEL